MTEKLDEGKRSKLFQSLSDKMGDNQFAVIKATCMDCHKPVDVKLERTSETDIEITEGVIAARKEDDFVFKCPECYEKDDYFGPKVDIYSRVVGYLRPVRDWNDGKQEEFGMRTTFKV